MKNMIEIDNPLVERAVLVGIDTGDTSWPLEESLAELERLANTAGAEVLARVTQKIDKPNPRTFIGRGKADELAVVCRSVSADLVIFDEELSPSQQSNLEAIVPKHVKVIDRTALILDIFALHASTREGRLQVRLAQNEYVLPRLRGMWSHLITGRLGGGVGSRFGEGESKLELDRRMIRKRINQIKKELAQLSEIRSLQRKTRSKSGIFKLAIVGYTNAGKSSLLNILTDADVLSYDKLFATLDSTTRQLALPEGRRITITDTVGFIQKLPTTLVEAFKSTLDEIVGADLILHVIDSSSERYEAQIESVEKVLGDINAGHIRRLEVFSKIDLLSKEEKEVFAKRYASAVFISSKTGEGIEGLLARVSRIASARDEFMRVLLPFQRGDLVSFAHENCRVLSEEHSECGTRMEMQASPHFHTMFKDFLIPADGCILQSGATLPACSETSENSNDLSSN